MPISVLLPTPDPPKMPTRCPRPVVSSASTTRMPVAERGPDRYTVERRSHPPVEDAPGPWSRHGAPVHRFAQGIQHAAQQRGTNLDLRMRTQRGNAVAEPDTVRGLHRHRKHVRATEPDDFRKMSAAVLVRNLATLADRCQWTGGLDRLAHGFEDLAPPVPGLSAVELRKVA